MSASCGSFGNTTGIHALSHEFKSDYNVRCDGAANLIEEHSGARLPEHQNQACHDPENMRMQDSGFESSRLFPLRCGMKLAE